MRFPDDARRLLILLIAFTVAATDCQAQQPSPFYQSPGTKKMAELLQKIYRESDWKGDPNKPAERAAYYKFLLTQNLKPERRSPGAQDAGQRTASRRRQRRSGQRIARVAQGLRAERHQAAARGRARDHFPAGHLLSSLRRAGELRSYAWAAFVHLSDQRLGDSQPAARRRGRGTGVHRVVECRPARCAGAMAAECCLYAAGPVSAGCSGEVAGSGEAVQVRRRAARVSRCRHVCGLGCDWSLGRRDHGGLRWRRLARHHGFIIGAARSAALLSQQRRWDI